MKIYRGGLFIFFFFLVLNPLTPVMHIIHADSPQRTSSRLVIENRRNTALVSLIVLDLRTEEYSSELLKTGPIFPGTSSSVELGGEEGYLYGQLKNDQATYWVSLHIEGGLISEEIWIIEIEDLKVPEQDKFSGE